MRKACPVAAAAGMTLWLIGGCSYVPQFIVTHDPLTAEEHIQLGVAYEEKKEWDHAIEEYRKALKKAPESMAYFYIGNAYCGMGDFSNGIKSYLSALDLYPHNGDIYNNLAWACLREGRLAEGSEAVMKALALEPDNPAYLDTRRTIEEARMKNAR